MPHYYIEMQVNFAGHIEAENRHEAEQLAYSGWGDTSSALVQYDSVEDVTATLDDDAYCEDHETYECAFCEAEELEEALV